MPIVSVIVPAYNSEDYIGKCIESVLAQTLSDFELIVVDDGSTDKTLAIAQSFAEKDHRVTAITQKNSYAGVARNNGMARATGDYLYFLDADDFIDRDMLEVMVGCARSCDADVVVCRSRRMSVVDGKTEAIMHSLRDYPLNKPLSQREISKTLFRSVVGWPWDKLFKRSFIQDHRLEYQPLRSTNDAYFVFIAMALAQTTYCSSKELVTHRVDNLSSTSNTRGKSWNNALIAMDAIGERLCDEGIYDLFERTYLNWCVNFVHWNISTLDTQSAVGLIEASRARLSQCPLEEDYYFLKEDYEFAKIMHLDYSELVLYAAQQLDKVRLARRIYESGSFKLLMKLKQPARFVYHRILKK